MALGLVASCSSAGAYLASTLPWRAIAGSLRRDYNGRKEGGAMITHLAHVCFRVADLERSLHFYCALLGLTPAFEFINPQGKKFGQYLHVGGRNFIELFQGTLAERAKGQSHSHICLAVKDIEATVKALREAGVEVSDVKPGGDQSYQAWLADPDGNRIELHGYTAASWQAPWLH